MLVEDPTIEKSAASASVAAGHFHDPENCQGLAHLLEHMLFLGSKHFHHPNNLSQLVEQYGGQINAWTGTEYSNFYFDIDTSELTQGIHQFADMLHSPLFAENWLEKEIQAIDAEFKLKQKDDLRRLYQVHKETSNPQHPFSQFSVGNQQVFSQHKVGELASMLRQFHQGYYCGDNISLCLVSNLPLDEQETLITKNFNSISPQPGKRIDTYPPLYLPQQLGVEINICPLKATRRLIISFALPNMTQHYRSKPSSLISQLIGDEGKGSLLWYYKQKGWATSLSSGGGIQGENFKDFNISMQLTESGLRHKDAILNGLFYYLQLIRQQGLCRWRFEEKQKLNQLAYQFHDHPKPIDLACHLSAIIPDYPTEHLLCGEFMLDEYSQALQLDILDLMTADNMRLKVIATELSTDSIANWYHTPYSVRPLSHGTLYQLKHPDFVPELTLPEANPYLVDRVIPGTTDVNFKYPVKLTDKPGMSFWYGQDPLFNMPKGDLYISFDCPYVLDGIEAVTHKRLWVALLQEKFNQQYYQASTAGLHFHIYPHQGGFSLHTSGFSDKQLHLAGDMLKQVFQQDKCFSHYSQIKDRQLLSLQNTLLNKPINRLFTKLSVLMQKTSYAPVDMAPVLQDTCWEDVQNAQSRLLEKNNVETLIYGDWQYQEAVDFQGLVETSTQRHLHQTREISRDIVDLRHRECHLIDVPCQHNDSAVVVYFQTPGPLIQDSALTIMVEQMWSGPFFHQLRTEQQLGYLVGTGYFPFNQHPGMAFYIQSPGSSAVELVEAIHSFIQQAIDSLDEYPQQEWLRIKHGVIKQLLDKDSSLSMKSQRLWLAIGNKDFEFNQHKRLAQTISELDLHEVKTFCQQLLLRNGFGEIILYSDGQGKSTSSLEGIKITDVNLFKQQAQYIK